MSWSPRMSRSRRARDLTTTLVASLAIIWGANANAQNYVSRPPSFQAATEPSFENQTLLRLALNGQYQPDDLPHLARLAFLESIAMLVDIRTDLVGSVIGNRLWTETMGLSEASEFFYEDVSSTPLDLANFSRTRQSYEAVEVSYRQVESTLGELPGLSIEATAHLRRVARLIAVMGSVLQDLESNLPATNPVPLRRTIERDSLQRLARLLSNALVELIVKASKPEEKGLGRQAGLRDLNDLLDRIQSFQYALSLQPSEIDVHAGASLNALRRRFWRVEATIVPLDWPAELRNGWRTVRGRMDAISDAFGMPRVMNLVTTSEAVARPASVSLARPITRVYRGSPGVRSETASK
jgi:hypothetical protein